MGRHSIPDPEDSAREPVEPEYGDYEDYGDYSDYDVDGDYAEAPEAPRAESPRFEAPRPSFAAEPSGPPAGGHRNAGEWTGSHRVVNSGRRGVSLSVIAALVGVVVLVAGVIVWRFFGDALSNRSDTAAARCLGGDAKVAVLADPAIADDISAFAKKFNESAGPVGDKCVAVNVTPADSGAVLDGLVGTWPESLGNKPTLWIPGSSVAAARLQAASGPKVVGSARSLATSPVLLAVRPELKSALDQQSWATLSGLQTDQASLDGLDLAGWGSLRLALPTTGDSDASSLAAEAVASASAPQGSPATAGVGAVNALVAGQPKLDGDSLDAAMKALLGSSDAAAAPVHAVVTTEQQLFHRAAALPEAKTTVAEWVPPGPTPVADFPAVLLAGDWIADEQASAASEFERFLHKPEQLAQLAKAGFRTEGNTPPGNDVTAFGPLAAALSIGDDSTRVAVANALSAPAAGQTTSIMLDRSLNLGPVVSAMNARIAALPPTSAVGLTTFDGGQSTTQVNVGALSDPVDGQTRSESITSTLSGLSSGGGGAVSFTTLRNVYAQAQTDFRSGQPNSVLVITSGPHTDQSLGSEGLQDLIRSSADPSRPVAVNVINVGDDPDRATWEAVAQISGGTYQNVPGSDSPELVTALNQMLA
jgi:hypothetical protein